MDITIRPLRESDLDEADRIRRLAFGTFIGLPDPMRFGGDAEKVRARWSARPEATLGAEMEGRLVGSNFAADWGSVGFFGPLSVEPALWNRKIAQRLLEPTMDLFASWGTRHVGLFTFAQSAEHVALYQKFGFWARFLTAIMACPVKARPAHPGVSKFSEIPQDRRQEALARCRELCEAVYEGLDLGREIVSVETQSLGDTLMIGDGSRLDALAICHVGAGTEAGSDTCYVKFGAVRPGADAAGNFERLLDASEAFAAARGVSRVFAGVNMARHDAYRRMLARGFRTEIQGVAMHRDNNPGYDRPDSYVLDDWR
jgi:predicted N-acetyltransferase YhbS